MLCANQSSMPYFAYPSRQILHASQVSKQPRVNQGLARYGKDFRDTDTNTKPRPAAPARSSSSLRWRNSLRLLHFSIRPSSASQSISLQPRRRNFDFFSGESSKHTVDVAVGHKKHRNLVSPPSATELARGEAAAVVQHPNRNEAGLSTQRGQSQAVLAVHFSRWEYATKGLTCEEVTSVEYQCCLNFAPLSVFI
ncbi:hypothetical protein BDR06DRAFT_420679 [Suillus hirtellus]|nr:hypothetical protein BDR06DRAFT_420679 [Suillus hirtellus]